MLLVFHAWEGRAGAFPTAFDCWGIGTGHGDKTDRSVLCVWQLLDRTLCRAECSPRLLLPPPCCSFCLLLSASTWVFQSQPSPFCAGLLLSHSENLSHSSWRLVTTGCPSVILTIFCKPSSVVCLWITLHVNKTARAQTQCWSSFAQGFQLLYKPWTVLWSGGLAVVHIHLRVVFSLGVWL